MNGLDITLLILVVLLFSTNTLFVIREVIREVRGLNGLTTMVFSNVNIKESLWPWGRDTIEYWVTYRVFWRGVPIGGEARIGGTYVAKKLKSKEEREQLYKEFNEALEGVAKFLPPVLASAGKIMFKKLPR